jgi:multidrug efflux pump subunit AcrA (membrane-fusion protein)
MGRARSAEGQALFRLISAVLLFFAFVCFNRKAVPAEEEEVGKVEPAEMQAHVKIATPRPGELPVQLHTLGTVAARQQQPAAIAAIVAGPILKVEVQDGQEITSGTVLIRLDDRPFRQALAKTEGALRAARSDLQMALDGGLDAKQADADLAAAQADIAAKQARREAERQAALFKDQMASEKATLQGKQRCAHHCRFRPPLPPVGRFGRSVCQYLCHWPVSFSTDTRNQLD